MGFGLVVSEVNRYKHLDPGHKRFSGYCPRKEKWTKIPR